MKKNNENNVADVAWGGLKQREDCQKLRHFKDPSKYPKQTRGRIPRGVAMVVHQALGKKLLAKYGRAEAKVPF